MYLQAVVFLVHQGREAAVVQRVVGILEVISVLVPVALVGEVAEVEGIDRTLRCSGRGDLPEGGHRHLAEQADILFPGRRRQVDVGHEKDRVDTLVLLLKAEIMDFVPLPGQVGIEIRTDAVGAHGDIAGGDGDEHKAGRLVGGKGIAAVRPGEDDRLPIRDLDIRHRLAAAGHGAAEHAPGVERSGGKQGQKSEKEVFHSGYKTYFPLSEST